MAADCGANHRSIGFSSDTAAFANISVSRHSRLSRSLAGLTPTKSGRETGRFCEAVRFMNVRRRVELPLIRRSELEFADCRGAHRFPDCWRNIAASVSIVGLPPCPLPKSSNGRMLIRSGPDDGLGTDRAPSQKCPATHGDASMRRSSRGGARCPQVARWPDSWRNIAGSELDPTGRVGGPPDLESPHVPRAAARPHAHASGRLD